MQTDVKVFIPEMLVAIFPGLTVKKKDFHYNIHVGVVTGDELRMLAALSDECNVGISLSPFNKGITIKVAPYKIWDIINPVI